MGYIRCMYDLYSIKVVIMRNMQRGLVSLYFTAYLFDYVVEQLLLASNYVYNWLEYKLTDMFRVFIVY